MPGKPPACERSRCSSCDVPSTLSVERIYPVVDAIGGTSEETHRAGLERVIQAGGRPVGWVVASSASATGLAKRPWVV